MAVVPPEQSSQTRAALNMIVAEYGPEALSAPSTMANLLKDLLPDAPRVVRMLVAAAEDHIADVLREHMSQGMDGATASRLAASVFAGATMFTPEACAWVVSEIAIALGVLTTTAGPPTVVAPSGPEPAPLSGRGAAWAPVYAAGGATVGAAGPAATAYVACESSNTVFPVDLPIGAADAPISTGEWPKAIAVTPDYETAYVANYGDGSVTPIAISSGRPGTPIKVGNGPLAVAIAPDGETAYVVSQGDNTLTPVSVSSGAIGQPISTGKRPYAVAIAPDGSAAYVANHGDGTVTPIRLGSFGQGADRADRADGGGVPGTPVAVGAGPVAIAIAPDGSAAYVANHADGTVTPISLASGITGRPITVGMRPVAIAVAPDGQAAYVATHGDGTVIPLRIVRADQSTPPGLIPEAPIVVGKRPLAIAITRDGTTAYVANYGDGTITPLSLGSRLTGTPFVVGKRPWAIAITS